MWRWKQTCVDCHFFVKEARGIQPQPIVHVVSDEERAKARAGDYSWHLGHYAIACWRGVWDEGHDFELSRRHEIVTRTQRRESCFFLKHHPGMSLPAARELQDRKVERRRSQRSLRFTIYGLLLAILALVVNNLIQLAKHRQWWPFD